MDRDMAKPLIAQNLKVPLDDDQTMQIVVLRKSSADGAIWYNLWRSLYSYTLQKIRDSLYVKPPPQHTQKRVFKDPGDGGPACSADLCSYAVIPNIAHKTNFIYRNFGINQQKYIEEWRYLNKPNVFWVL